MENVFKVNQTRKESASQVAKVLNEREMLFQLDVVERVNDFALVAVTDVAQVEYTEKSIKGMESFLEVLKGLVDNKDDIDELLEELSSLQHV